MVNDTLDMSLNIHLEECRVRISFGEKIKMNSRAQSGTNT